MSSVVFEESDDESSVPASVGMDDEIIQESAVVEIIIDTEDEAPTQPPPLPEDEAPTQPAAALSPSEQDWNDLAQSLADLPLPRSVLLQIISMGFNESNIRRSARSLNGNHDVNVLVDQCIFFDQLGTFPQSLLQGKSLEDCTFLGSIVTSSRLHMTYTVAEVDKDNACMFVIPTIYRSYDWGTHSRKARWVCVNDPDIHWETIAHDPIEPEWACRDETVPEWFTLPEFTIDVTMIAASCRGKDWAQVQKNRFTTGNRHIDDIIAMGKRTGSFALVHKPRHIHYDDVAMVDRFHRSVKDHINCICTIHNIPHDMVSAYIHTCNREELEKLGHGLLNLFEEYNNSFKYYKRRYRKWKSRCLPLIQSYVYFDWIKNEAKVSLLVNQHMELKSRMLSFRDRKVVAEIIARSICPPLFTEHHFSNGFHHNVLNLAVASTTENPATVTPSRIREIMCLRKSVLNKLFKSQRRLLQFAVEKANSTGHFGWSTVTYGDDTVMYHVSGYLANGKSKELMNTFMKRNSPSGGVIVQPPKSGKSLLAALFVCNQMEVQKSKAERSQVYNGLVVVNKCAEAFISNAEKFISKDDFKFHKWSNKVSNTQRIALTEYDPDKTQPVGHIYVVTISQLKLRRNIWSHDLNYVAIAFDDAHCYANNPNVLDYLELAGQNIPRVVFTQNKQWNLSEFNFYMLAIEMFGFSTLNKVFARALCNGDAGKYTFFVNLRKKIIKTFCMRDSDTIQKGRTQDFEVTTKLLQPANNDMAEEFYKKQMVGRKKCAEVSELLHTAAFDMTTIPIVEFSNLKPRKLNGVDIYRQRLKDAVVGITSEKESSQSAKRKLEDIYDDKKESKETCPICMEPINNTDKTAAILDCEHLFCASCIEQNLLHSKKCPLCRKRTRVMRKIDDSVPETTTIGEKIIEKELLTKWNSMRNEMKCPKADYLLEEANKCGIGSSPNVTAFYSRFKKICSNLYEKLTERGTAHVFAIKKYSDCVAFKERFRYAFTKFPTIVILFPSAIKYPLEIVGCKKVLLNETFLTQNEYQQVMSRFLNFNEDPPKAIIMKTVGSIDTAAGSYLQNNTEQKLVGNFFCNRRVAAWDKEIQEMNEELAREEAVIQV